MYQLIELKVRKKKINILTIIVNTDIYPYRSKVLRNLADRVSPFELLVRSAQSVI